MASLGIKDGVFLVRFRYRGREHKKSLKTRNRDDAKAAVAIVEVTLHRILTGQIAVPPDVNPGDFIVSGGTLATPKVKTQEGDQPPTSPPFAELVETYLDCTFCKKLTAKWRGPGGVQ